MKTSDLHSIFGIQQVSDTIEDREVCSQDASTLSGDCLAVVWPLHVEQVSNLAAWACREGIDLVPRGAGTGLCGGATPQGSVVVDFSRMSRIGPIHADARRIQVDAGVALDALNRTLQPHGIFLPVIPGSHRAASIGGMLATNAAGLHAVHYGKMGDWVEQITLVDGCGQIRNLAGAASEDAVGREGVTGFIVRAVLRLTPRPVKRTLSLRIFTDITGLLSARAELLLNERLTAMEYVNPHAAAAIGWNARHYLLIEFDGAGGDIEHPTQMAALWQARDHLYPRLAQYGYPVIEDPQISGDGQAHLLDWMDLHEIPAFGHLGMGIIHPCFRPDDRRVSNLYTLTAEYGGCVSGEHGIGLKKKSWVGVPYQAEIARLKQIYDPQKILNRGKLC